MEITKKFVEEYKNKRFTIIFEDGTMLKNIKLFISTLGGIGYLCGHRKRNGFAFPIYNKIKEVIEINKKEYTDIGNAKTILKKIHPNAWRDLQIEMNDVINNNNINKDFEWHFRGRLNFKNITKYLNSSERNNLHDAFENKKPFRWHRNTLHHRGRDLSISCEIDVNGDLRAYFSSEYMGCGNGDYWLLLNPTTAIFYETD